MGDSQAHTLRRRLIANSGFANEKAVKQYLKDKCRIQYLEISDESERSFFEHFSISVLKPKFND
jgi:hypothetical protein